MSDFEVGPIISLIELDTLYSKLKDGDGRSWAADRIRSNQSVYAWCSGSPQEGMVVGFNGRSLASSRGYHCFTLDTLYPQRLTQLTMEGIG